MALMAGARDAYTAGHQKRVAELVRALATEMGLGEAQIELARHAALVHDIGKIAIPAEIVSKPSVLSEAESSLVKNHPRVGHDILTAIDFPWPIAQIVLQHHERLNGSGYPQGLSGEEILLEARIIAVADVVEAMICHRPYRPALGIDAALREITMNSATLYDPVVVEACTRLALDKHLALESDAGLLVPASVPLASRRTAVGDL